MWNWNTTWDTCTILSFVTCFSFWRHFQASPYTIFLDRVTTPTQSTMRVQPCSTQVHTTYYEAPFIWRPFIWALARVLAFSGPIPKNFDTELREVTVRFGRRCKMAELHLFSLSKKFFHFLSFFIGFSFWIKQGPTVYFRTTFPTMCIKTWNKKEKKNAQLN